MVTANQTHREVKNPQISGRQLADYMAGSERARRAIAQDCKYQARVRVIQHHDAKLAIGKFLRDGASDLAALSAAADFLRTRWTDDHFERSLYDNNADYIARFAHVATLVQLPAGDMSPPGKSVVLNISGVKVTIDFQFRISRVTKTNKLKIGAGILRYSKGRALAEEVANWQSAFILGCLRDEKAIEHAEPESKLCLTIDAYSGRTYSAPGDSSSRYANMKAACASLFERWPQIKPPDGAVL